MAESEEIKSNSNEDLLKVARDRFKLSEEAFDKTRQLAKEDLEFKAGIQWDEQMRRNREALKRPCLTINRIPQFTRQITNDQKQNRPSIRVLPVDDGADVDSAKIFQGIIRHIEYNSNAESAYDHAFEGAVDKGFGFFRIITDYVSPTSFLQEALIKRIPDHFAVAFDPFSREPDGSDANWAFIFEDMPKDDFKAKYKDADICADDVWQRSHEDYPDWIKPDSCRVAEYFYKDFKQTTVYLLDDGRSVTQEELDELKKSVPDIENSIQNKRSTTTCVVRWAKIVGNQVLEETEFPGQWIPIIPVYGSESMIDGKRVFEGIIRHAKDPQRMYNFWATAETETIALAPKAPFIAAAGQIEGFEDYWQNANTETHSVLPYNPIDISGTPVPPPQRNAYEPPTQAITGARMQSAEDIKATTGIYDAALGARSNENSGIAIQRRANQTQTSNYHFVDNLNMSMRHAGRILLEIIPVIYDTPRTQRILGEDGQAEIIRINEEFQKDGKTLRYDLGKGKYDVVVEAGPGFATKRQEAVASILEFITVYPAAAQVLGDLLAKNMDWPGAQEISERLRRLVPPNVLGEADQQIPPQAQAQMQQLIQTVRMLQGALADANAKIGTKKMELESKERIEFGKMEVDMKKELLKAHAPMSQAILQAEIAEINRRQQLLGFDQPINPDFAGITPDQGMPNVQQPTGGQPGQFMGV
nr:hypothetical protein BdHM001_18480 [Bdellovibrio sp. HM001]